MSPAPHAETRFIDLFWFLDATDNHMELEPEDEADDSDDEPSLGSFDRMTDQSKPWAAKFMRPSLPSMANGMTPMPIRRLAACPSHFRLSPDNGAHRQASSDILVTGVRFAHYNWELPAGRAEVPDF